MKWQDYYDIEFVEMSDADWVTGEAWHKYRIVEKSTGKIIGTYKDEAYANKQARYKFKKILNRVEKLLLG